MSSEDEKPPIRALIARLWQGHLQTKVARLEEVQSYRIFGWHYVVTDPGDEEALASWLEIHNGR